MLQHGVAAQPRAAQCQRQLQAREIKPSSVQIKHVAFQMTRHGRGGKDVHYHGTQFVRMNKSGSGNALPACAGPSAVLEAASSAGTMGAGSPRQHWRPATERNAAGASFGKLVGTAEPAPRVPFLGTFTAQTGAGGRGRIWGTLVP